MAPHTTNIGGLVEELQARLGTLLGRCHSDPNDKEASAVMKERSKAYAAFLEAVQCTAIHQPHADCVARTEAPQPPVPDQEGLSSGHAIF